MWLISRLPRHVPETSNLIVPYSLKIEEIKSLFRKFPNISNLTFQEPKSNEERYVEKILTESASLQCVRELNFIGIPLLSVSQLTSFKDLTSLTIHSCALTDTINLNAFPHLNHLDFEDVTLKKDVPLYSNLHPRLLSFRLDYHSQLSSDLQKLPALTSLIVIGGDLTDDLFDAILSLTCLTTLGLEHIKANQEESLLTGNQLESLKQFKTLTSFDFYASNLDFNSLLFLVSLPNIAYVNFEGCNNLNEKNEVFARKILREKRKKRKDLPIEPEFIEEDSE